jgi:hypothetical protein
MEKVESTFIKSIKAARRVSTPIIAVQTPDPASTIKNIVPITNGAPLLSWDIVRGILPINDAGVAAIKKNSDIDYSMITNPTEALLEAQKLPARSILFFHNAQLYITTKNESVIQAIWNLRDTFKQDGRTLILLTPNLKLPTELTQDILILDEPLPTREELGKLIQKTYEDAGLNEEPDKFNKAVESLVGLSAFSAEQVTAMSLTKTGIDLDNMWERKRKTIEAQPGLSVWKGSETLADVGGLENIKSFLTKLMTGNEPPNVILFIDEVEKVMGTSGGTTDTSGTSQEMMGEQLSYMEDNEVTGVIAIGPPGAGKSLIAKVAATIGGILCIQFNFSAMKDSLVGNSTKNLRNALKVVDAVSGGKVLCIATCNSITSLPPELRRRFSFGTFFFDLPSKEERISIWPLYLKKYGLLDRAYLTAHDAIDVYVPNDEGWTGAEIRNCCNLSYRLNISLVEAASYIVPVCESAKESIDKLRREASGRFISASTPGKYIYKDEKLEKIEGQVAQAITRRFDIGQA